MNLYQINPWISFQVVLDEIKIADETNNNILKLNISGQIVWKIIWEIKEFSKEDIYLTLTQRYHFNKSEIVDDIEYMIEQLTENRIISLIYVKTDNGNGRYGIHEEMNRKCFDNQLITLASIELTNKCNASCCFCFRDYNDHKENTFISTKKVLSLLDELSEMNCYEVLLTGGEPLLHHDFLKIVKYARTLGLRVRINTNGILLSKDIIDSLSDLYVRSITVSIHSHENAINQKIMNHSKSVSELTKNINYLLTKKIKVCTSTVLCKYNIETFNQTKEYLNDLGVDETLTDIAICDVNSKTRDNKTFLFETNEISYLVNKYPYLRNNKTIKDIHTCKAGYTELYISASGYVFPCSILKESIGNIYKNSLLEIKDSVWSKKIQNYRWKFIEGCTDSCPYINYCTPCYGRNLIMNDDVFKCSCELKARAKASYEFENELNNRE